MGIHLERNRKAKLREKATRKLPLLLERQSGKCRWCGCSLVNLANLRERKISYEVTHGKWVHWLENGKRHTEKFATVDHIKRIADGGGNDLSNLVASCSPCNNKKNRVAHGHQKDWQAFCIICGQVKPKLQPVCNNCWKECCEEILGGLGFDRWVDHGFFSYWQCPLTKRIFPPVKALNHITKTKMLLQELLAGKWA